MHSRLGRDALILSASMWRTLSDHALGIGALVFGPRHRRGRDGSPHEATAVTGLRRSAATRTDSAWRCPLHAFGAGCPLHAFARQEHELELRRDSAGNARTPRANTTGTASTVSTSGTASTCSTSSTSTGCVESSVVGIRLVDKKQKTSFKPSYLDSHSTSRDVRPITG